ncbi:MAG: Gmad2 immunoglobulin-like domain-containing protein [Patescibacteria group bacterium]
MKKENFLLLVFLVVILSALVLRLLPREYYALVAPKVEVAPAPEVIVLPEIMIEPKIVEPKNAVEPENVVEPKNATSSEVVVNKPMLGEVVVSPLTVEGRARGNWFFEATLPVKLITKNGDMIIASYGQAQSDWMTSEFVPFKSVLEFSTTATSGYLVIAKDNPSGLPEHDASIKIPVLFK